VGGKIVSWKKKATSGRRNKVGRKRRVKQWEGGVGGKGVGEGGKLVAFYSRYTTIETRRDKGKVKRGVKKRRKKRLIGEKRLKGFPELRTGGILTRGGGGTEGGCTEEEDSQSQKGGE